MVSGRYLDFAVQTCFFCHVRGCYAAAAAPPPCFATPSLAPVKKGQPSTRITNQIDMVREMRPHGISPGVGIISSVFTATATLFQQGQRQIRDQGRRSCRIEGIASSPLQSGCMSDKFPPWSTGGRLFLSRSQFYLGNVDNTKRHNRDDGTENHLRLWWRRRRQRPLVVCPLACVSQERAASDDGQFSDDVGVSSDATENSVCKNTPDGNKAEVAARKVVKSAPSIRSVRPEHREEPENRQKPTRQKVGRPKGSTNKTAKSKKNHSSLGTSLGGSRSTPNDHSREAANATEAGGNSGGDSANSPYEEKHVGEPCSSLKNSATSSPPRPPASRKDIPQIPPAATPQAQYQQLSALSAPAHQDTTTSGVDDEAMPSTALTSASRRKYRDRRVQSKATTQSTTAGVNANNEKTPNTGVGDKVGSSSIEQKPGLGKPRDFPPEADGVTPGLGQGGGHLAGTEGIGTDGNKTNPAAGAKIIANSIMRTRRAFAKTGVSADGQEDEQGKDEVCRGGRGRGENHHKGVASRAMPRRKQLSEDKDTMGEASTELASDDTEKPKAQKRSRSGNGEGGNNSDDDFVLEEKGEDDSAAADVKKQHQRHDEYEHWDLLHQAEAAAILGERLSVRRAIQLPSHHPDRGIATPRADKNPKLPLPTFSGEARTTDDEDEQQVDRVDDGGDSEHFGSDKFFPPPPNANPLEAEVMATIIPGVGDDFDDDGGIDPSYGVIPDDVELVPPGSATTTTAPMPSAMGSAVAGDRVSVEGGSSVAVWSLKERLGMSDEEVQALRASNRSGLADSDLLVEQKLTGAESGGPTTALGYLLENLRMKPWEVKETLMRCPDLLKITQRGAHAVSSWLQGGLGLTVDHVAKMFRLHPTLLAYSVVDNLRPKFRWLQEDVGLSRVRAIRVLVRCPMIFGLSIPDNMGPKMVWLIDGLHLSRREAASVISANPGVLVSSVERNLEPKIDWMAENLQMKREMVIDMIERYPMFFSLNSERNLRPKIDWLCKQAPRTVIRRMIYRQPSLLGMSVDGNIAPKVQWLQDRLGMSKKRAWEVIGRSPGFLTLSVADNIEPKLWWLRDKLEMTLEDAGKLVGNYPNLLSLSIEESLEPKLWWARDDLELNRPDAASVLRRCPQIFGSSLDDTLKPKIAWLAMRLKTTKKRVIKMVLKYPPMLSYSIDDNLAPTIDFFEQEMGAVEPEVLLERLEARPTLLSASLSKRLTVRVAMMRAQGLEPAFREHVRPVGSLTDAQFKSWLSGVKAKTRARAADSDPTEDASPDQGGESSNSAKSGGSSAAHGRGSISDSGSKTPTSNVVTVGKKKKIPIVATEHVASENP